MHRFKGVGRLGFVLLLASGVATGCSKKEESKPAAAGAAAAETPPSEPAAEEPTKNPTLVEMERAKKEVCACADLACAEAVLDGFKHLDEASKTLSPEDKKASMSIGLELAECLQKIGEKGVPAEAEDPPTPQASPEREKEILAAMEATKDAVCSCTDAECVDEKDAPLSGLDELSPEGRERALAIAMKLAECEEKLQHDE